MVRTSFSTSWKRSTQPRKQRKYQYNAPLHIKQKMLNVHLSPELRKKYNTRSIQVRNGDKVKVLRGKYKKKEGKIDRVNLKTGKVFIGGLEFIKKEGSKIPIAFTPTNLMIISLNLEDKKRRISSNKETKKIKESKDKKTKTESGDQK